MPIKLYNCDEAAELLKEFNVCPRTVDRWYKRNKMTAFAISGVRRNPLFEKREVLRMKHLLEERFGHLPEEVKMSNKKRI